MTIRELIAHLQNSISEESDVIMQIGNKASNILSYSIVLNQKNGKETLFLTNEPPGVKAKTLKLTTAKKYIVIGGRVQQRGRTFYFNAWELCRMYKIRPDQCFFIESDDPEGKKKLKSLRRMYPKLPLLSPRADGNYSKPLFKRNLNPTV